MFLQTVKDPSKLKRKCVICGKKSSINDLTGWYGKYAHKECIDARTKARV